MSRGGRLNQFEHEHTREDRNSFVKINFANISSGTLSNFEQQISLSSDLGAYDYGSIMHYPSTAFSSNGLPTIETIPAGIAIGQRTALSAGDIGGVRSMYTTVPQTNMPRFFRLMGADRLLPQTHVQYSQIAARAGGSGKVTGTFKLPVLLGTGDTPSFFSPAYLAGISQ